MNKERAENKKILGFHHLQIIENAEAVDITDQGYGVVKINTFTIFVKNLLLDEVADIRLIDLKKNFAIAEVLKIKQKSHKRITPACPYFPKCGGCHYQHLSSSDQISLKEKFLKKQFDREVPLHRLNDFHYRNKISFWVQDHQLALVAEDYNLLLVASCQLANKKINQMIPIINNVLSKVKNEFLRRVIIRQAENELLITYNFEEKADMNLIKEIEKKAPYKVKSVINLGNNDNYLFNKETNEDFIIKELNNLKFLISSKSFYQVNEQVLKAIIARAKDLTELNEEMIIGDLYCGLGVLGASVADDVKEVVGIEINEQAVDYGKRSLDLNKINNMTIIQSDLKDGIDKYQFDLIIVDPPRSGLSKKLAKQINDSAVERVLYISCNPNTLRRDLNLLTEYQIEHLEAFEMFPQTNHVECMAILKYNKASI